MYAELVVLGVGQDHERVGVGLADIDPARAECDETLDLGLHVTVGPQERAISSTS
jgi:hypothetical protein